MPREPKDAAIHLRVATAEAKKWNRAADSVDMTLSDWVRRSLNQTADGLAATRNPKGRR